MTDTEASAVLKRWGVSQREMVETIKYGFTKEEIAERFVMREESEKVYGDISMPYRDTKC